MLHEVIKFEQTTKYMLPGYMEHQSDHLGNFYEIPKNGGNDRVSTIARTLLAVLKYFFLNRKP